MQGKVGICLPELKAKYEDELHYCRLVSRSIFFIWRRERGMWLNQMLDNQPFQGFSLLDYKLRLICEIKISRDHTIICKKWNNTRPVQENGMFFLSQLPLLTSVWREFWVWVELYHQKRTPLQPSSIKLYAQFLQDTCQKLSSQKSAAARKEYGTGAKRSSAFYNLGHSKQW